MGEIPSAVQSCLGSARWLASSLTAQLIFLGVDARARLGGGVLLAQAETKTYFIDLSAYPEWLIVLVGTLLAVVAIWIVMKLLKWTLWLLLFAVLVGGLLWAMYLLIG